MTVTEHQSPLARMLRTPAVPHAAFWSMGLVCKLLFPMTLKWLAYDSISTMLLSVWYPLCATISLIHRNELSGKEELESLQLERQFWIEYWSVGFASVQFLYQFVLLVPSLQQMGRYDYPQLPIVLSEIQLLFFAWIFSIEPIMARYQQYLGIDENWKRFVPLTVLTQTIGPRLMRVQMAISEQISRDTWHRLIQRKAQRVLELMVVFQFMGEESMSYLLQLLDEGRSLLLLSVFAVMPSSICQLGTLYAQFVFPGARSLAARGNALEIMSLKYWVMNSILSLFLTGTWWIWWCIPFSNQLILGIRCFATFPSTISHHYSGLEMELITFGILKGEPKIAVRETKTVQALRAVVKRLPRDRQASSFQFEIDESESEDKAGDADDSSVGSEDTTESEEERRRQRRREKRAKKRLLKQQKLAESNGKPPPLLPEGFISQHVNDNENDTSTSQRNGFVDNDAKFSSFINSNSSCESKSESNLIDLTQYGISSTEREQRDARNVVRYPTSIPKANGRSGSSDNEDSTIGSSFSSSQVQSGYMTPIDVATPTEAVVGEVEVQVRASDRSGRTRTPLFPATHPNSYGMLAMPSASSSASYDTPQTSNDNDEIDTNDSGCVLSEIESNKEEINESFESWDPSNEDSSITKTEDEDEVISAPRRSSRLLQLREWQAQKREEEEAKVSKKKKSKIKPRPEGPRDEPSTDKKGKKSPKKSTGIFQDKGEKKWKEASPKKSKKSSKTSSPSKKSTESKLTTEKKVKKKSTESPEKKKSKKKGEASLETENESSKKTPQKTPKAKKVPNSRKKKKEPSTIAGIFGRK